MDHQLDPYQSSRVLKHALETFLEKAEEVKKAYVILYDKGATREQKAVDKAVMTIYGAVPSLQTAVEAFQWVIDSIEEEAEVAKPHKPTGGP